jgi:hypothetical protein
MQIGRNKVGDCFKRLFRDSPPIETDRGESSMRCTDPQDIDILACFVKSLAFGVLVGVLTAVSRPPFPAVCIQSYVEDSHGNFKGSDA